MILQPETKHTNLFCLENETILYSLFVHRQWPFPLAYPGLLFAAYRLEVLSHNQGKVLTYAAIIRKIWGPTDDGGIKKLQVNMANIRKKIGSTPGDNKYIINELGVGYRIGEENF